MERSDFWWLGSSEKSIYKYTELGHHKVIRDDEDPRSVKWDTSIWSIDKLEHWCDRFENTNVYRSLKIASASSGVEETIGPFLVDIDNGEEYLEDALVVTRKAFHLVHDELGVYTDSLKIFFTGHKGFNLEIRPQALNIQGSTADQVRISAKVLRQLTEKLRQGKAWQTRNQVSDVGTVVDQIYGDRYFDYRLKHPYIRLHGSINTWISSDGKTKSRMKIQLTVAELNRLSAAEISNRAEKLAT